MKPLGFPAVLPRGAVCGGLKAGGRGQQLPFVLGKCVIQTKHFDQTQRMMQRIPFENRILHYAEIKFAVVRASSLSVHVRGAVVLGADGMAPRCSASGA